jgi:manganese/zinc/iron transport system permease protein
MVAVGFGLPGKPMAFLLVGAAISGLLGVLTILFIRSVTRLKEDAALGIVLSVFFGAGVTLLVLAQQMKSGNAAGLEAFIYGKTASMVATDAWLIVGAGVLSLLSSIVVFKELKLLCFDESYAASRGYPTRVLDILLMSIVMVVTLVGLQAVGLVLIIALLIIPSAAARFWTSRLLPMALASACIGMVSGILGTMVSASAPRLPSGAMIVLVASALFGCSLFFGSDRGLVAMVWRRFTVDRRIDRRHLLRAMYELQEVAGSRAVNLSDLLGKRSWSRGRLQRAIRRAFSSELLKPLGVEQYALTRNGQVEAARLVREHRLWELYLISHADVAVANVDRDADAIEHVLDPAMIAELESMLAGNVGVGSPVPASPHDLHPLVRQEVL